eukprot:CAMPEP_0119325100 /NCGR_PEP_ID=MMETSP1333-20130426/64988_1 /TAXON_ID=418940 /ORGANISM="Scyphosphaera apsteinii, Strain RCC1455" /LENGTH=819 /DNA_ID=CAMNT_0007332985 /DNA_START=217 /DNA_END=2676 /DNA_ORIENTATION=+
MVSQGAKGIYEVVVPRPLGLQLEESPGRGVVVSLVLESGNAAQMGVQVGDIIIATSASVGSQMWDKKTLAGVQSAIQTRVDGQVRLRFKRERFQPSLRKWEKTLNHTYEVELTRPLGLVLRQRVPNSTVHGGWVEVQEVQEGSSAAASGVIRPGDVVLATSASVGALMWEKRTLEGVLSAISTRLALSPSVRLRLLRTHRFGRWASELNDVRKGHRTRLSPEALVSYRRDRRKLNTYCSQSGEESSCSLSIQVQDAMRALCAPAFYELGQRALVKLTSLDDTDDTQSELYILNSIWRRLKRAPIDMDASFAHQLMVAFMRCGDPSSALSVFDSISTTVKPTARLYTTTIKCHIAKGQQAEAFAVLPRMRAEQVSPEVYTYNALMSISAKSGDRRGMLEYFRMIERSGLRPDRASWNIVLNFCARKKQPLQATDVLKRMRMSGVQPDAYSYANLIQSFVANGDVQRGRTLLEEAVTAGVQLDVAPFNALLGAYAKSLRWFDAFELISYMEGLGVRPDELSYSLLLRACVRAKIPNKAKEALQQMRSAGIVGTVRTYSMLLSAYAHDGLLREALELLRTMQSESISPNKYTYSALMEACIVGRQSKTALAIWRQMLEQGVEPDRVTYTLLVRARSSPPYSLKRLVAARTVIGEMHKRGGESAPNVITYNEFLHACVSASQFSLSIEVLNEMLDHGISPTRKTSRILTGDPFGGKKGARSSALSTPSHAALEQRLRFFLDVVGVFEYYRRQLDGEAYIAMLSMCARLKDRGAARRIYITRHRDQRFVLRNMHTDRVHELEAALGCHDMQSNVDISVDAVVDV